MGIRGTIYSIQAGSCAAMASVCAKLAVSSDASSTFLGDNAGDTLSALKIQLLTVMRIIAVGGIVFFNILMWILFTKSMHLCSSTLEATIFNTASNFFFTAVVGNILFGEQLGVQWCVGSALLITGLTVLHHEGQREENKEKLSNEGSESHMDTWSNLKYDGSKSTKVS